MFLHRWVLLVSLLAGAAGIWAVAAAFTEYRDAARAFATVDIAYVPGSFVWLAPDYSAGRAELVVTNHSPADVTIEFLDARLYFDGEFAGAHYAAWQPLQVARGTTATVALDLRVATSGIQARGGDAELALRGAARLRFAGIERPLTTRLRGAIGRVPAGGP
jgi:hypothetical protein